MCYSVFMWVPQSQEQELFLNLSIACLCILVFLTELPCLVSIGEDVPSPSMIWYAKIGEHWESYPLLRGEGRKTSVCGGWTKKRGDWNQDEKWIIGKGGAGNPHTILGFPACPKTSLKNSVHFLTSGAMTLKTVIFITKAQHLFQVWACSVSDVLCNAS